MTDRPKHDMGGLPGGQIDQTPHDPTFWDQQIDAIVTLLGGRKRRVFRVDELRRGIEALDEDAYRSLSYYERWIASVAYILVEKGVLTQDEIDRRIAELKAAAQ